MDQDLGLVKFKPFITLEEYSSDVVGGRDIYEDMIYSNVINDIDLLVKYNVETPRYYFA